MSEFGVRQYDEEQRKNRIWNEMLNLTHQLGQYPDDLELRVRVDEAVLRLKDEQ